MKRINSKSRLGSGITATRAGLRGSPLEDIAASRLTEMAQTGREGMFGSGAKCRMAGVKGELISNKRLIAKV